MFCNAATSTSRKAEGLRSVARWRRAKPYPFDDYHILTIESPKAAASDGGHGGSHRSPREHLRRGHIRRLEDGRKLWINATVVNAGVGGKVSKDYRIAGGGRDA